MELFTEDVIYRDNQLCARHEGRVIARVVCDSVAPDENRTRLTTLELVVPRIVLAEFNTHRALSRNSASSRAIPIEKMLQRVLVDPYIPETWGRNGRGMQATEALSEAESAISRAAWLQARDSAVDHTKTLLDLGVHKQTTNRLLEPFMWHTIIVTATEWSNFRHLRAHADAHPAIQNPAKAAIMVLDAHEPAKLDWNEWHLPFIHLRDRAEITDHVYAVSDVEGPIDKEPQDHPLAHISSARCGRVSYLTHDGEREISKDVALHSKLLDSGHMSPFEHPAFPFRYDAIGGKLRSNFAVPWVQYRKLIPYEHDVYSDPERPWSPAA